jgi:hypothetical protein
MTTSGQGEATAAEEHAAPPQAWDTIAEGYDRYVAPQEVDLANEALRLAALQAGERFLDVAQGQAVSACRPPGWARRCSRPTGHPR